MTNWPHVCPASPHTKSHSIQRGWPDDHISRDFFLLAFCHSSIWDQRQMVLKVLQWRLSHPRCTYERQPLSSCLFLLAIISVFLNAVFLLLLLINQAFVGFLPLKMKIQLYYYMDQLLFIYSLLWPSQKNYVTFFPPLMSSSQVVKYYFVLARWLIYALLWLLLASGSSIVLWLDFLSKIFLQIINCSSHFLTFPCIYDCLFFFFSNYPTTLSNDLSVMIFKLQEHQ